MNCLKQYPLIYYNIQRHRGRCPIRGHLIVANVNRRTPTVGSVSKKIMEINPKLNAQEIIFVIKQSVLYEYAIKDGFTKTEVIDEEKALEMARATCVN